MILLLKTRLSTCNDENFDGDAAFTVEGGTLAIALDILVSFANRFVCKCSYPVDLAVDVFDDGEDDADGGVILEPRRINGVFFGDGVDASFVGDGDCVDLEFNGDEEDEDEDEDEEDEEDSDDGRVMRSCWFRRLRRSCNRAEGSKEREEAKE